jgi:hypothetical protein
VGGTIARAAVPKAETWSASKVARACGWTVSSVERNSLADHQRCPTTAHRSLSVHPFSSMSSARSRENLDGVVGLARMGEGRSPTVLASLRELLAYQVNYGGVGT